MFRQIALGAVTLGAVGALSICDTCVPGRHAALPVAAAAAAAFPASAGASQAAHATKVVRFRTAGIGRYDCCLGAGEVLTQVSGVDSASFSYEKQEAIVRYDPSKVTISRIVTEIARLGYRATEIPANAG